MWRSVRASIKGVTGPHKKRLFGAGATSWECILQSTKHQQAWTNMTREACSRSTGIQHTKRPIALDPIRLRAQAGHDPQVEDNIAPIPIGTLASTVGDVAPAVAVVYEELEVDLRDARLEVEAELVKIFRVFLRRRDGEVPLAVRGLDWSLTVRGDVGVRVVRREGEVGAVAEAALVAGRQQGLGVDRGDGGGIELYEARLVIGRRARAPIRVGAIGVRQAAKDVGRANSSVGREVRWVVRVGVLPDRLGIAAAHTQQSAPPSSSSSAPVRVPLRAQVLALRICKRQVSGSKHEGRSLRAPGPTHASGVDA